MQGIRQGFPLKLTPYYNVRLRSLLLHLLWAVLDCINVFAALSGRFGGFFLPGAPNGLLQILMKQKIAAYINLLIEFNYCNILSKNDCLNLRLLFLSWI